MGGKKKGKKGKKGKKSKGLTDDATVEEKNWILQAEKEALEQKLILTMQSANRAKAKEQEKAHRQLQLKEAQEAQKRRTDAIVSDMTRQYKSTDEELRELQAKLEARIDENKEEIEALQKQKLEIEQDKKAIEDRKNEEIKELNTYIETMHANFSSMLKKTLEKMKERIQRANDAWAEEQDTKLIAKFKEIIDNGQQQQ